MCNLSITKYPKNHTGFNKILLFSLFSANNYFPPYTKISKFIFGLRIFKTPSSNNSIYDFEAEQLLNFFVLSKQFE